MNVGTVSRVIIFTKHMRLLLVHSSEYQEWNILVYTEEEAPSFVSFHLFQWLQYRVIKRVSVCTDRVKHV
jgi:hypothetical protein